MPSRSACPPSGPPRPRRRPRPPRRPPREHHQTSDHAPPHRRAHGPRRWLNGRHADTARRRQRVITALDRARAEGAEISVSGIARAAVVDRSFLYRHRDLLEKNPRPRRRATHHQRAPQARRSPEPRCRPTCSPPTNAPPGSTPASSTSRSASPKHSASTPGASPGSVPQPTSTPSTSKSPTSNNRPSICAYNSTNATRTSPPPAPPTANSWPVSTHPPQQVKTHQPLAPHLLHPITFNHQPLSCANARNQPPPQGRAPENTPVTASRLISVR